MLYVFGNIDVKQNVTDALVNFIKNESDGLFVLPESFLLVNHIADNTLERLTSDGKKVIVAGSDMNKNEKARLFAYGCYQPVLKPVYDSEQIFTVPYEKSEIRIAVRVCSDIFRKYSRDDFDVLCHPSSINLHTLNSDILFSPFMGRDMLSRLGLENKIIASSDTSFSGEIIDASGKCVGDTQILEYGMHCKKYAAEFKKNK